MTISSRTPEGTPNRCPICAAEIVFEPSRPAGDAPCPACGHLLWFVVVESGTRFFDPQDQELVDRVVANLGINPEAFREGSLKDLGIDSLDLVEVILEMEEGESQDRDDGL